METKTSGGRQRKPKFDGEPEEPPESGYQLFFRKQLAKGELSNLLLKDRIVAIGKRWRKLRQNQKDDYKKLVEEQQAAYQAELEAWVKSLSPQDRAVYKKFLSSKRRSTSKVRCSPVAKVRITSKEAETRASTPGVSGRKPPMASPGKDSSDSEEEDEEDEDQASLAYWSDSDSD